MPAKPKYKKEYCQKIIPWFSAGWSILEVCRQLDISRQSYYDWQEKHPEWKEATIRGEELAEAYHDTLGRLEMIGKPQQGIMLDKTLYMFTMKTRFKRRETGEITDNDPRKQVSQPLQINFTVAQPVDKIEITNSLQQQIEEKERQAAQAGDNE